MRLTRILGRIWKPLALIGGLFAFCVAGFILTERVTIFNGIYWGVITMSTVGYGDVVPTNFHAKLFAILLAGSTLGILGYILSTISTLAVQAREEELLGLDGTRLRDHVIMLGWTPVARAALQELILSGRRVALMTRHQDRLTEIRVFIANLLREGRADPELRRRITGEKEIFLAYGEYSQGAALKLLNLDHAREAIVASDDDTRNVMTALLLKGIAPHLRVVVAVMREELRETLHAAGVTYVISPADLGGRMVAAAAVQPEVAQTFDDLTTASYHYGLDEFPLRAPNPLVGRRFEEALAELRRATGATLVGVAQPRPRDGGKPPFEVRLSPPADLVLVEGHYLLVLSESAQEGPLRAYLGVPAGRPPAAVPRAAAPPTA